MGPDLIQLFFRFSMILYDNFFCFSSEITQFVQYLSDCYMFLIMKCWLYVLILVILLHDQLILKDQTPIPTVKLDFIVLCVHFSTALILLP